MGHHNRTKQEDTQPAIRTSWIFDPNESAKYFLTAIVTFAMTFVVYGLSYFFATDRLVYGLCQAGCIFGGLSTALALICAIYVWVTERERPKLFYKKNN